ncbi:hypothetical protein ASE03_32415 [Kitasatospora sp. Root187]|nr:hypothetical protein ASC99_29380 [Kitasatospora sp. Root107]KRB65086.1 hypothetical protein ASE03_32415 [Kitasatospora sp. Root187]
MAVKVDIGADAGRGDAEDIEEADPGARQVINLVDAHRLQRTSFGKKGYLVYLKGYLKQVESPPCAETAPAKTLMADFDSYSFYQGEISDAEGMVALARPTG